MGTGSATITESIPNERVVTRLEYQEPMVMGQDAIYELKNLGSQTQVIWKVTGRNGFFSRLMCLIMNVEKQVGESFSKGLAKLKLVAEKTQ
jgi:hypothetical protein